MNWLEFFGALVGLLYLYLEYKVNIWLWAVSVLMPAIYFVVYLRAGLYADSAIQVYYLLAAGYGLACWLLHPKRKQKVGASISKMPLPYYLPAIIVTIVLFCLIGWLLKCYTNSTVSWADAFTTSLSITAMWMLAKKYVEQWLVWIVADVCCTALYLYKDLYFTAGLYLIYTVVAVAGYYKWKKLMNYDNN